MSKTKNPPRLYIDVPLSENRELTLSPDMSHYVCNVMRLKQGENIVCFNGTDGEYFCTVILPHKKQTVLQTKRRLRPFAAVPDVWLLFAPVKKERTDYIIEKATELGISKICPVYTAYTNADTVRTERYRAQAIEAAEQCRRLDVPEIIPVQTLTNILKNWDINRIIFLMDESGGGQPALETFRTAAGKPAAILVGPEGGFSEEELLLLRRQPFVRGISLGPRILRAETAVAAALALWQAAAGDWK